MHIKNILLFLFFTVLASGGIINAKPPVFLNNYNESVKVSKELNQPLILIFSADWCRYCVQLKKDISNHVDQFPNTTICIVDIDTNKNVSKKYRVKKIPKTIVFNRQGKKIKEFDGYIDFRLLKQ